MTIARRPERKNKLIKNNYYCPTGRPSGAAYDVCAAAASLSIYRELHFANAFGASKVYLQRVIIIF